MGILKDKVEKSIEKKREIREGQKKYADKCRDILNIINALDKKASFESRRKVWSAEEIEEVAEEMAKQCEELGVLYLEGEPELLSVKGLKEKNEEIVALGKKVKEDVNGIFEIERLLEDAIECIEK